MPQITLTQEQTRILLEATESVEVRDPDGRVLSFVAPMDAIDVAAVTRFKNTRHLPRETIPAAKVAAHLKRLEEVRHKEGLDEKKMFDLLRCMQAGEEV
jgi:hypothetical protein